MATKTQSKTLYTLENPEWLNKAGMSKGIHHDRQHLGIILPTGSSFKIRQTSTESSPAQLNLRLLNADQKTEKSVQFGADWLTVIAEFSSVPFVDTPLTTATTAAAPPTVEYEYELSNVRTLPVYRKYDSEVEFFSLWDSVDADFALIISDYAYVLVPKIDKECVRKLGPVSNINGLMDYFDRVLTFYNELSGLSFEPNLLSDKNIRNRYFLKADVHGAGGAYYSDMCSAQSAASIQWRWLDCQDKNWGNLHEIAHGYQGRFMSTEGFSVGEVWNNVYAARFQNVHLGTKIWTDGWLYDYGKSDSVFQTLRGFLNTNKPLDSWDLRSKLNFLMELVHRGGQAGFTHFNQSYRKHMNQPDYLPERHTLLDMLSASFSKVSKIDTTPFIQRVGGILSDAQLMKNQMFHEKVVYPICELVDSAGLSNALTLIGLKSPLSLVDPSQLKPTGLTGTVDVTFDIDSFLEIYGEDFKLMEGQRYALTAKITSPALHLAGVPIGVYTLIPPLGKGVKYNVDKYYLVVKQGANSITIKFSRQTSSALFNQGFNFLGLGNGQFASVRVDYLASTVNINVTNGAPHSYFVNEKYAQITVKSTDGATLFDKTMNGTNVTLSSDKVPFQIGYKLELWHAEPGNRLVQTEATSVNILTKDKLNVLTIGTMGVVNNANTGAADTVVQMLKALIAPAVDEIRKYPRILASKYDKRKNDVYLALQGVPENERKDLMILYQDVLPKENETPGPEVGNAFLITFLGLSNAEFFRIKIDLVEQLIHFTGKGVQPHYYFYDQPYAWIKFTNTLGLEKFKQNFVGEEWQTEKSLTFPISYFGGEELLIHHAEPSNRLVVTNEMQDKRITAERNTLFSFASNGLRVIRSSPEEAMDKSFTL